MKKIIIYLLIASLCLILFMCNFTKYKYYNPISKKYFSYSIKESKDYGVFIAEYIPENDIYIFLGDTLIIQEIWLEKCWESTYFWNEVGSIANSKRCCELMIIFKNDTSKIFPFESKIRIKNGRLSHYGGYIPEHLYSLSYQRQPKILDTLIYQICKNNDSLALDKMEIIGEMRFFKKN